MRQCLFDTISSAGLWHSLTDEYYRYVICIMKAENELRLIRIFEGMADHYNNLRKASYKGGEDV